MKVWGTEVEDADLLENRALGGMATQLCTAHGGDPSRAIDSNTNGWYGGGSVTHTCTGQGNNWWQVYLPSRTNIMFIEIWNRSDGCCRFRLSDADVEILDADNTVIESRYIEDMSASDYISFDFGSGSEGHKVRIKLRTLEPLSLTEVKVWGTEAL